MTLEGEDILKEIIEGPTGRPTTYHIMIESSEDGMILDAEVQSVIFLYSKGDEEGDGTAMRVRGLTMYEIWGWLGWAYESHKNNMMGDNEEPAPLADEDDPDGV